MSQELLRILFLQFNHAAVEERGSLGTFPQQLCVLYAVSSLKGTPDQKIEVNIDAALFQLGDEEIFPVKLVCVETLCVLATAIDQPARRFKIKKLEAHAVHAKARERHRPKRCVLFGRNLSRTFAPVRDVDPPEANTLPVTGRQMAVLHLDKSMFA